jgi:type II secretory pathway component GspD/PulD (secretin)
MLTMKSFSGRGIILAVGFGLLFFAVSTRLRAQPPAAPVAEAAPQDQSPAEFVANYEPTKSYTRLLYPNVAAIVGLTPAQQTEVSRLVTERATQLGAATDQSQWPEIVRKNEEQLKSLLNPEQLKNFDQAINDKLITIRFSKTPWKDVLKWFAAELGLQLVMNAPPPGTFDYSDKNSYTPNEAFDILNGRLQFQGYTLLRTGNMLYVHNFKDGTIPLQYVPKVTLQELPEQNRFSYVALTLPLEQRSLQSVLTAIKPFQGPYNSTQALTGNALLIVDSVNALREIVPVALAIVNPPILQAPPALLVPTWESYPLTNVTPELVATEVLKFVPSARSLVNPNSNQISYLAIPSVHAVISGLIKRLEEGGDPAKNLTLAVYPLDEITGLSEENIRITARRFDIYPQQLLGSNMLIEIGNEIVEGFRILCPAATISFNALTKQVMVVASPDDHEKIKKAVEELKTSAGQSEQEAFSVYFLGENKGMSSEEVAAIQKMVPMSQVTYDRGKNSLLVVGHPRDQKCVSAAVEALKKHYADLSEERTFASYPMTTKQLAQFNTIFEQQKTEPKMEGLVRVEDAKANRVGFWGTRAQLEAIRAIVEELTGISFPSVTPNLPETGETPADEGGAAQRRSLDPEDFQAASEERDVQPDSDGVFMKIFYLGKAQPQAVTELLRSTVPGIEIDPMVGTDALVIYGTKQTLATAERLISELETTGKKVIETFPYSGTFPMAVLPTLQREEPSVSLTLDPIQKQFLLFGPADAVRRLTENLTALADADPLAEESIQYVGAERDIPAEVSEYIRRLYPRLTVTYDARERRFTLIGNAADREGAEQIIAKAEESLPETDQTCYYPLERRVTDEFLERVREVLPEAEKVERSEDNPNLLLIKARPEIQEKVMRELDRLQEVFPESEEKVFAAYSLETELKKSFDALLPEFEKENGLLRVIGYENELLGIWAFPGQHEKFRMLLDRLRTQGRPAELQKTAQYYDLKYAEAWALIPVLQGTLPEATVTVEPSGNRLLVSGTRKVVAAAVEFLATLDIKPAVAESDRFLRIQPRRLPAQTLSTLIHAAFPKLTPSVDPATDSLLVNLQRVPKEDLLAFIDKADPETPSPLEPTLKVYSFEVTPTQAMVDSLEGFAPGAKIILQPESRQMLVIAKPSELATIDKNVGAIQGAIAPAEPYVKFYAFDREPTDETIVSLTGSLKKIAPQATVEVNKNARQLMVIAKDDEQKKIEESVKSIIETFNPVDLKLVAYPVSGMDVTALCDTFRNIYPDIKVEVDTAGRRLLIWATLDQHVRISEEIASINAKSDTGTSDYNGPKCSVFISKNGGEARTLERLIRTMFPAADVYTEAVNYDSAQYDEEEDYWRDRLTGEQRLTVLAPARELALIGALFEQFRVPSNLPDKRIESWSFGSLEPEAVEMMIQNLLPAAVSLSPSSVGRVQKNNLQSSKEKPTFFRVDPRTRTVSVYAEPNDLDKVDELLENISQTDQASEMSSDVYSLSGPIAQQVVSVLEKMVPAAQFAVPDPYQIIAFASEADRQSIARFVDGLTNLETSETHQMMKSVFLPDGCKVPRDTAVRYLTSQFFRKKGYAYSGAYANQIILWGTARVLDEMVQFIDEACTANVEENYRSYPVDHLPPAEAVALLQKLTPNATITPDVTNKKVTVLGSPLVQKQIETALAEIDAKRVGDAALTAKYYDMEGFTPGLFPSVYTALVRQFPQAVLVADPVYQQFTIVATEAQQELITEFFESMKTKRLEAEPVFEVYTLSHANYKTLLQILTTSVPGAGIIPGKQPGEFYAFAKPEQQEKIRGIVAKIDTIYESDTAAITPKVYRVDPKHSAQAVTQLAPSLPGAQLYPLTGGGVLMWGSPSDHQLAEKYFGTFAEAYPEPVIKRYPLKHIVFADVAAFLSRSFPTEVVIYPGSNGDLLAEASEPVQEKIAAALAEIDVRQRDDLHPMSRAYDIGELPAASHPTAVTAIMRICPHAVFLPTATPGYFVIYAKPTDQEKIGGVIEKMVAATPNRHARFDIYGLRNITYANAAKLIAEIAPTAKVNPGTEPNQVIVWARETDHAKIADAVKTFNRKVTDGLITRVYHLSRANLVQAQAAVRALYQDQVLTIVDPASRTITVNALEQQQEKVAELIREIERTDEATQPNLRVLSITGLSATSILTHLQTLYANDPEFKVSVDTANQSLVVQGNAEQIAKVSDMIAQIRRGGLSDSGMEVRTYTLRNSLVYYTLRGVFRHQGRSVDMQVDYSTGKLVALARPEEHRVIESVIDALAPEPTVLAVYDLYELEPDTAASVISTMLESDGTFVDVQPDEYADKLYIRATAKKQEEIRQFLIQAGETSLRDQPARTTAPEGAVSETPVSKVPVRKIQGSGTIRTIHADGDLQGAVRKVKADWQRPNPIRVVSGGTKMIQTKERPEGIETPEPVTEPEQNSAPVENPAPAGSAEPSPDRKSASILRGFVRGLAVLVASQVGAAEGVTPKSEPIYAIFNPDHSVTITSSDTAALDDFQQRLLAVLRERGSSATTEGVDFFDREPSDEGASEPEKTTKNIRALTRQYREAAERKLVMEDRDYSVYKVENVSVDQMIARLRVYMADKLNPKPTTPPVSTRGGVTVKPISGGPRLQLQPDDVMNTIMVKGKKADRDEAGAMIALLDKAELFPQPITKPVKIPVRNTSVTKMAQQVLNVFQLKFMSMKLPGGLSPRILPNTDANILEVYAPKELAEEIAEYVKEADAEILEDKTSQVKVVPLEELNAMVFQKYIDNLKGPQNNYILVSPYTISPQYTRQPRQF